MQQKNIGFIGLGLMGSWMCKNLLRNGFDLTVYDMRKEAAEELKALGASIADSCKEVAAASDVIISMVRDDSQTDEVFEGESGIWAGVKSGSTTIISSTIDPLHCQHIAAEGEKKDVKCLDAPVSGGRTGAEAATLTFMIGGDKEAFEKCRPIIQAMGNNIFYLGSSGMGQVAKVVNGILVLSNLAVLSDAVTLGLRAGLKLENMLNVFRVSTGGSWLLENWDLVIEWWKGYCKSKHGSTLENAYKDIGLALKLARDLEVYLPVAGLCSQLNAGQFFPGVRQ